MQPLYMYYKVAPANSAYNQHALKAEEQSQGQVLGVHARWCRFGPWLALVTSEMEIFCAEIKFKFVLVNNKSEIKLKVFRAYQACSKIFTNWHSSANQ